MKLKSLTIISLFAIGLSGLMSASAQSYNSGEHGASYGYSFDLNIVTYPNLPLVGPPHLSKKHLRANEHLEAGNYAEAERLFRRVRRDYRSNAQVLEGLGMAHFGQADWKLAATALRHSVSLQPNNHHARLLLGLSYLEMDQDALAAKQLAKFQSQLDACDQDCRPALIGAAAHLQDAIAET